MSFDDCIEHSKALARLVSEGNFDPSFVLGIAKGGMLPAQIISEYLERPLAAIHVERPLTGLKKGLGLRRLPQGMKTFLRKAEMSLGLYRRMERRVIKNFSGDFAEGRCLIVDDSLDTGKTVSTVIEYLSSEFGIVRSEIEIAVITQMYEDADPPADYCTFRNINFCFPWSLDSGDYGRFLEFIESS